MNTFDAPAVAALLREIGRRVELTDDSPFKARAYFRAAEALSSLSEPLDRIVAENRVRELPGVGAALDEKIRTLHATGSHRTLDRLRAEVPAEALQLLDVPGLPPQKARELYRGLHVAGLAALEQACRSGVVAARKGFGPAMQQKILDGIALLRSGRGRHLIHGATELLAAEAAQLARIRPDLRRVTPAGDVRRACEIVDDLTLVAESRGAGGVVRETLPSGVGLVVAGRSQFGFALLRATGGAGHLAALAQVAASRGLDLREDGAYRGRRRLSGASEERVYAALGLPFIPPELREDGREVVDALDGTLPSLVEASDLRGIVHCHTVASDGADTLESMAEAARERGYEYLGVSDHSRSAFYAGGMDVDAVAAQQREADRLNRRWRGFRILKGVESDILADGSLDYPADVLRGFDFVVASVHSRFRLSQPAQTQRIVAAVTNPFTTILGHMTGRLLLRREGYGIDVDRILRACAAHDVAVEVNGNPNRLDLDWRWHRRALELGCRLSINPDAHSIAELDLMRWGLGVARKGGVPADRVLNAMGLAKLRAHLARRRRAALASLD